MTRFALLALVALVAGCQQKPEPAVAEPKRQIQRQKPAPSNNPSYDKAAMAAFDAGLSVSAEDFEFTPPPDKDAAKLIEGLRIQRRSGEPLTRDDLRTFEQQLRTIERLTDTPGVAYAVKFKELTGLTTDFASHAKLRQAAFLLRDRARLFISEGDLNGAIADLRRLARICELLEIQPNSLASITATGIKRDLLLLIPEVADAPNSNRAVLQELRQVADFPNVDVQALLSSELVSALQLLRVSDQDGDERLEKFLDEGFGTDQESKPDADFPKAGPPRNKESAETAVKYLNEFTRLSTETKSKADPQAILAAFNQAEARYKKPLNMGEEMLKMTIESTRLVYRTLLSGYSFSRLVDTYLKLRIDPSDVQMPTDPLTGKPFRYEKTPTGFKIWGPGRDLVDNGGKPSHMGAKPEGTDDVLIWTGAPQ